MEWELLEGLTCNFTNSHRDPVSHTHKSSNNVTIHLNFRKRQVFPNWWMHLRICVSSMWRWSVSCACWMLLAPMMLRRQFFLEIKDFHPKPWGNGNNWFRLRGKPMGFSTQTPSLCMCDYAAHGLFGKVEWKLWIEFLKLIAVQKICQWIAWFRVWMNMWIWVIDFGLGYFWNKHSWKLGWKRGNEKKCILIQTGHLVYIIFEAKIENCMAKKYSGAAISSGCVPW